jgi:hypothetical protein
VSRTRIGRIKIFIIRANRVKLQVIASHAFRAFLTAVRFHDTETYLLITVLKIKGASDCVVVLVLWHDKADLKKLVVEYQIE